VPSRTKLLATMAPKAETNIMIDCVIPSSYDAENDIIHQEKTFKKPLIKKSVQWKATCTQVLIEHIDDMSESEIRSIWYDKLDYRAFKKDCKDNIKLAREGNLKSIICLHGLEPMCAKRAAFRRASRINAWDVVLNEQYKQLRTGQQQSPELIAELYQEISLECQRYANLVGIRYQQEL
jgi:hypothetical protein